jgi:ABC-type antimicrobial peptide transport system permease subunit
VVLVTAGTLLRAQGLPISVGWVLPVRMVWASLAWSAVVGVLAGYPAARRAATEPVAEALRAE